MSPPLVSKTYYPCHMYDKNKGEKGQYHKCWVQEHLIANNRNINIFSSVWMIQSNKGTESWRKTRLIAKVLIHSEVDQDNHWHSPAEYKQDKSYNHVSCPRGSTASQCQVEVGDDGNGPQNGAVCSIYTQATSHHARGIVTEGCMQSLVSIDVLIRGRDAD